MEITLILKGATPAEVREALRELYAQGTPCEQPMEAQPVENEEKKMKKKSYHRWTEEEDKMIIDLRDNYELGPTDIAKSLFRKYGFKVTRDGVKSRQYLLDGRRNV